MGGGGGSWWLLAEMVVLTQEETVVNGVMEVTGITGSPVVRGFGASGGHSYQSTSGPYFAGGWWRWCSKRSRSI